MDFSTNLPNVDGYDTILILVCTLSKMAHFIPCNLTVNSRQLANVFLDIVYHLHGLPRFLIVTVAQGILTIFQKPHVRIENNSLSQYRLPSTI
jgi:hypothetical protein